MRRVLPALLALALAACLGATALRVDVTTEVDCGKSAPVVVVVGSGLDDLATKLAGGVVTARRSGCSGGDVGDVVLTPPGAKNAPVAFAVMTRNDGNPPDTCAEPGLAQADRNACIVAKRSLRFTPHTTLDVGIDLRLSCLGVVCGTDQTCVKGVCVGATCVGTDCSEVALGGGGCDAGLTGCGGACVDTQTSNQDCGGCGLACPGGCNAGRCVVVLATGQPWPYGIAVDANNLYWTDQDMDSVTELPLDGGAPVVLADGPFAFPQGVAIDAHAVYWTALTGTVMSIAIGGGPASVLVSGQNGAAAIAVDGQNVYWTVPGGLWKAPSGGGSAVRLATGSATQSSVAVDPRFVYWTDAPDAGVTLLPLDGGPPTFLAPGTPGGGSAIAADATSVYWSTGAGLMKVPIGGGAPVMLSADNATGITVDTGNVYWVTDGDPGAVMKMPTTGGPPVTLASGQPIPFCIAVDATSVYWANRLAPGGTIMKVTPK